MLAGYRLPKYVANPSLFFLLTSTDNSGTVTAGLFVQLHPVTLSPPHPHF